MYEQIFPHELGTDYTESPLLMTESVGFSSGAPLAGDRKADELYMTCM